jgi:hypothetical protein
LARQTQVLITEPSRVDALFKAKIAAYKNMAEDIFSGTLAAIKSYTSDTVNKFHYDNLIASTVIGSVAISLDRSTELYTRADFIDNATDLIALRDSYQTWVDANFDAIEQSRIDAAYIDTSASGAELDRVVYSVSSSLFSRALRAKTEIREPLLSDRSPIDLCFEYYGTLDFAVMDQFIQVNVLEGEELILIPRGREIVHYV